MTAIDRAFIRAYETDETVGAAATLPVGGGRSEPVADAVEGPVSLPMPHVVFPPIGEACVPPVGEPAGQAQPDAERASLQQQLAQQNLTATGQWSGGGLDEAVGVASPERRPLSAFAPAPQTSPEVFKPALEVDAFRWTPVCQRLAHQQTEVFIPLVEHLLKAAEAGRSLIGFLGTQSGVGCTTATLCMARLLSAAGKSVAVVDGHFAASDVQHTTMADQLGLAVSTGWEEVLAGEVPLAEGVIRSLEDQLAVLPLAGRQQGTASLVQDHGIQASVTAGVLRYHYDMVLFDLGFAAGPQAESAKATAGHCRLDAVLVVSDPETDHPMNLARALSVVAQAETDCLGLVENRAFARD